MDFRVGFGYDVHRMEPGIPFRLGGVRIAHEMGAVGHSDADVLLHAICDALLGAAALGDIGSHFPDTDPAYRGISSLKLLRRTIQLLKEKGHRVVNIDSTVCLQTPRIQPYIQRMREEIASAMECGMERVSVKATTEEGLGFTGRKEGVSAYAVALIE